MSMYDLNGDGVVNQADVDYLVHNILHTNYGDASLSGLVSGDDLRTVLANWQKAGGWADGNFAGGALVDYTDFQIVLDYYNCSYTGSTPCRPRKRPSPRP